jgi:predicted transcriptional regulator
VQDKKRTKQFQDSALLKKDHLNHRSKGKFTSSYNQLRIVRECRFKSLEEKVDNKKYDSMEIFKLSKESIIRYSIALLSLPLVTSNGRSRSVNTVKGNALKYLCGFNYKAATLDKHIRELKYLQISNELIEVTAKFWLNFWKSRNKTDSIFACYYIDGNTKALWSSKSCHKGKVTMLGRIMNCTEQLFIHDGQGHPLYFKTFNGHADLGKNGLKLMEKITEYLKEGTNERDQCAVNRILIMDGGGNAVKVLREITDYYYITILDSNQINERKIKCVSEEKRYEYGDAYLIDCKIELKDSNDGYLLEPRAVQIKWDNGRTSTLVTNLPKDLFSTDNVVKSYFDRWPKEELDFKDMKKGVNIHRMVGYGKKIVNNPKVIEKIELLQKQIKKLEKELSIPLSEINSLEKNFQPLIRKETVYREKSTIKKGKREFKYRNDEQVFMDIQKQIDRIKNNIKDIKNENGKSFKSFKKKKDELARIIDKKKRYYVDVELDQLMTCFKISFANVCRYLFDECFEGKKMSLQSLFESIFDLSGKVKEEDKQRKIFIDRNPKQVNIMKRLAYGFEIINNMKAKDIKGYTYNFRLV